MNTHSSPNSPNSQLLTCATRPFEIDTGNEMVIQFNLVFADYLTQLLIGAASHQAAQYVIISLSPTGYPFKW